MVSSPGEVVILGEEQKNSSGYEQLPPREPKLWDTLAYIADPDSFCLENARRYGPIFRTSVFGANTVFMGSRDGVRMALSGDNKYTEIALPQTTMDSFGEYSLFQRPDLHRVRKEAIQRGLTGSLLTTYLPRIDRVIQSHLAGWSGQKRIPLLEKVEALCFDVLAPLLLGVDMDGEPLDSQPLSISGKEELKRLYQYFYDGFFGLIHWDSPLTAFGRGMAARRKLLRFMEEVMKTRRRQENSGPPTDFLGMMLHDQRTNPDSIFDDALIANQCLLQLWGAHYEVTGLLSSWMVQLAAHPSVIGPLRAELRNRFEISPPHALQMDDLGGLPYLDATINETLRTLPPTSSATRRLTKTVVLNGITYRKGWGLMAEPRLSHRLEENYNQPDRFDPNRFLHADPSTLRFRFFPFGGGAHACPGAQLSFTIARLFAIRVLPRYGWTNIGTPRFSTFPLRKVKANHKLELSKR